MHSNVEGNRVDPKPDYQPLNRGVSFQMMMQSRAQTSAFNQATAKMKEQQTLMKATKGQIKQIATQIHHKPTQYLKKDSKQRKNPARRPRTSMGGTQSLAFGEDQRGYEYQQDFGEGTVQTQVIGHFGFEKEPKTLDDFLQKGGLEKNEGCNPQAGSVWNNLMARTDNNETPNPSRLSDYSYAKKQRRTESAQGKRTLHPEFQNQSNNPDLVDKITHCNRRPNSQAHGQSTQEQNLMQQKRRQSVQLPGETEAYGQKVEQRAGVMQPKSVSRAETQLQGQSGMTPFSQCFFSEKRVSGVAHSHASMKHQAALKSSGVVQSYCPSNTVEITHQDLKKPKSHVSNNKKNDCNLMNYLIGKDNQNLSKLAPDREMGRMYKKQKTQWNGNSRQTSSGMGRDPVKNYYSNTTEPLSHKGGKVKQFVEQKQDQYHWSTIARFMRQDSKNEVVQKSQRLGPRPQGIVNPFQSQVSIR